MSADNRMDSRVNRIAIFGKPDPMLEKKMNIELRLHNSFIYYNIHTDDKKRWGWFQWTCEVMFQIGHFQNISYQ